MAGDESLAAAQVRFVQVSPGTPEMDFYVNGTGAAYNVGFANFTSYLPVSPGPATVAIHRAGAAQSIMAMDSKLLGGHQYTAVVVHGLGSLQTRFYTDQETPAAPGQISLRVLNEVEGTSPLTVYITPAGVASGAAPVAVLSPATGAASAYISLPADGMYTVTATVSQGTLNLPVSSTTVKAPGGAVRSVVFAGVPQPGRPRAVGFVLDDADAL